MWKNHQVKLMDLDSKLTSQGKNLKNEGFTK